MREVFVDEAGFAATPLCRSSATVVSGLSMRSDPDWKLAPQVGLERAILDFKEALPGWWFSIAECQVSCDASCAPTVESPDIALALFANPFDSGFHADLAQPSSMAEALRDVMTQARAAKAALNARPSDAKP